MNTCAGKQECKQGPKAKKDMILSPQGQAGKQTHAQEVMTEENTHFAASCPY